MMYSIFNGKIKKHSHLEEGEPPPKKLVTEEEILIKKLTKNQLETKLTLTEQLSNEKKFISSETVTNVTSYVSGKRDLKDFESTLADVHELNNLKIKGLSDQDIEIYKDYTTLKSEFWIKYKSTNKDVLCRRINEIRVLLSSTDASGDRDPPGSIITLTNESETKYFPGPMDELSKLEKQFMKNVEEYSSCNIKKIRKKARSMGKKIRNIEENGNLVGTDESKHSVLKNKFTQRDTQWDVKEKPHPPQPRVEIIDRDKVYGCKPVNLYTLKNGKIVKLDSDKTIPKIKNIYNTEKSKLTLEDIKNIPKFSNYDPGLPSKVLFLKNLRKNITESCLRNLLMTVKAECYSVNIMSGKMIGQAFVEFKNEIQASEALEVLNGVILEGKPIIVVYGKKKN